MILQFLETSRFSIDFDYLLNYRAGRTRGYAFVYLKNAIDAEKVIDYVDGRHIRSRQIRYSLISFSYFLQ